MLAQLQIRVPQCTELGFGQRSLLAHGAGSLGHWSLVLHQTGVRDRLIGMPFSKTQEAADLNREPLADLGEIGTNSSGEPGYFISRCRVKRRRRRLVLIAALCVALYLFS